ncbi:hypothetical protein DAETH_37970 (plasmid) [Deinococcus aetherius]|uniref:AB hydrolase-1 domain-containing protein n=1 Tax=Deinococcus aetherius TaxID=200252 RepID=A0ABN6RKJ1_9DEIO|nr:alpha/beta hydrolase [Deinococcus aetherius]BDP43828.1 hypothetical protein DAETH_37970 [Deinococcus aetherius]
MTQVNSQPGVSPDDPSSTVHGEPRMTRLSFESEGVPLVAHLFLPPTHQEGERLPALLVAGSWTTVKEQMANLYARKLARLGFATLTFDFRSYGESGGDVREYESPPRKIVDLQRASEFLATLPQVDGERVGGLAVCASAGYMAHAIAQGAALRAFATIAAWMHDPGTVGSIYGGEEGVRRRIERGEAARRQYEQTGEVEYVPAESDTDQDAAMVGVPYYSDPTRGNIPAWRNAFAVMSWPEWLGFDALSPAPRITVPSLFIHSDDSALPDNVRRFYGAVAGPKTLHWAQGAHIDFYDREELTQPAAEVAAAHFHAALR